jgi:AcrR family transcriptional regulator
MGALFFRRITPVIQEYGVIRKVGEANITPKSKISRQEIIDAAFKIVREHGWSKLSARTIARTIKSSTMPIYSQFESMADLEEEVVGKAMALLGEYESKPHTGVLALDHGIGYVLFAWEEPDLFAAINDGKHIGMQTKFGDRQFDQHVEELSGNPRMQGLSNEQLRKFQFLAWIFVHGIASMKNWMDETQRNFTQENLIGLIRDGSKTLTYGFIQNQRQSSLKNNKRNNKKKRHV